MTLLPLHIVAGVLALIAGAVAMAALKGGQWHRKSGMVFVIAILVMTASAVLMAAFFNPNRLNVVAGGLTFYLVSTALLTVRRSVANARGWITGFMLVALAVGAFAFRVGFEKLASEDGRMAAPIFFVFGSVAVVSALLDARMLLAGAIQGAHRLARHLWRMGFAMLIATLSFFLGQAKFFPEPIRQSGLLAIPVLLVLVFLLYWLVRVLRQRRSVHAPSRCAPTLRRDDVAERI